MNARGMRLLLAATVVVAAALPAPALAAGGSWSGVVVGKDGSRGSVATASANGAVRTVRTPSKVDVGQRLSVKATRLPDGTYAKAKLRASGRATKARIRGVLVRRDRAHGYIVSAGDSMLAIRAATHRRTTSGISDTGPKPGDKVVIAVTLGNGTATATDVKTVGQANLVELDGIYLGRGTDGALRLAVAHKGEVFVAVPATMTLPTLAAGDLLQVVASVDDKGAFTLVSVQQDDGKGAGGSDLNDDDELEVEGRVSAISATSISVTTGRSATTVTCAIPAGKRVPTVAVGDRVEIKCTDVGGRLTLRKLEADDNGDDNGDDDDEDDDDDEGDDD